MFVRRKNNPSGSISVYVVDKSGGRYSVVRSFGTTKNVAEADLLENKAREFVREQTQESEMLFARMDEAQLREYARTLDQGRIELAGPELVYGTLFDRLGLGAGRDPLFRHMVICRLFDPGNKLRTINYLRRYLGKTCEPAEIYALVDSLRLTEMRVSSAAPATAFLISTPLARVPLCLLVDADGRPVAGRLLDRAVGGGAKKEKAIQRLARKYGATDPVVIVKGEEAAKAWANPFRMSQKDLTVKPMRRRKKGRVEGHLCVCLAASAVQYELERQLSATAPDLTLAQVRQAVSTMFRLNYISPYTHRPKSVLLPMDPLQKQIFDLIHTI